MLPPTTAITDWIGRPLNGYFVNAAYTARNAISVAAIIDRVAGELPDVIVPMSLGSLHITLLDWVSTLRDYDRDKDVIFREVQAEYDHALSEALTGVGPVRVIFDQIRVTPQAVIIVGRDDGQFEAIRNGFVARIGNPDDIKRPPTIIHTTLCRFKTTVELGVVERALEGVAIHMTETVSQFRLVQEVRPPMMEYEVVKRYLL